MHNRLQDACERSHSYSCTDQHRVFRPKYVAGRSSERPINEDLQRLLQGHFLPGAILDYVSGGCEALTGISAHCSASQFSRFGDHNVNAVGLESDLGSTSVVVVELVVDVGEFIGIVPNDSRLSPHVAETLARRGCSGVIVRHSVLQRHIEPVAFSRPTNNMAIVNYVCVKKARKLINLPQLFFPLLHSELGSFRIVRPLRRVLGGDGLEVRIGGVSVDDSMLLISGQSLSHSGGFPVHGSSQSVEPALDLLLTFLLLPVFLLEVLIEPVGPLPDASDVQREEVVLLRRRTDGERMPFEFGDGRDLNEDPVSGRECEIMRPFDNQIGHFGRKNDAGGNRGLPSAQ